MLTIMIPSFSLLLIPLVSGYYWHVVTVALLMILITSSPSILQYETLVSVSPQSNLDLMASALIILTAWITILMFMASSGIKNKSLSPKIFTLSTISLFLALCLSFSASNLLSFYIWFEATLVPTMILIMLWGYQPERLQASMYLMVYTIVASLPLLLMLCSIYFYSGTAVMSYPWIMFPLNISSIVGPALLLLAFLVKLPMFFAHLWLPKAHVEAPVAGSMILAAILLKLGGYGLIRMVMLFPNQSSAMYSIITSVSLVGAAITSLICLRQTDMKSLIAYSSVGHMGLMIAGIMSNSALGMMGGLAMMVAHGLISSSLFCMANITYEYSSSRSILLSKGLLALSPVVAMWWFLLLSANMAAPPSINLLSEILLITSTLARNIWLSAPLMLVSFLGAAYSLYLYSSINHGWPMKASNSIPPMSSLYSLTQLMHITPAIFLILCPSLITSFT